MPKAEDTSEAMWDLVVDAVDSSVVEGSAGSMEEVWDLAADVADPGRLAEVVAELDGGTAIGRRSWRFIGR